MGYKNLMCEAQRPRRSRSLVFLPPPVSDRPNTAPRPGELCVCACVCILHVVWGDGMTCAHQKKSIIASESRPLP